jgi:hypothetical protein
MSRPGYRDLQQVRLRGPHSSSVTLKIGEKFCWINPELEAGTAGAAARRMIEDYGNGPFVCEKITSVPAGWIMITFKDKNGYIQGITSEYFTKY